MIKKLGSILSSKIILTSFLLVFISLWLSAQTVTNYTFTASTGTFTALSGATSPSLTAGNTDDGNFNAIPIGFDFWYMGTRYTTVSASTNGWVALGSTITDSYTNNLSGGGTRPLIAPLWDDLDIVATTNFTYKTTGTEGNRIFTIEYLNVKWVYNASGAVCSFQVNFYEGTGKIEFVYRSDATAARTPSASIGITASATGSGNFLSVNDAGTSVSSTVEASVTAKRASGTTYAFTPPVPTAPSGLTFSSVNTSSMTLNWTDNSSNETGFLIYKSTDGVTYSFVSQTAANAVSSVQSGLAVSTTYYWKVYAVSEGGLSAALSGSQATATGGLLWYNASWSYRKTITIDYTKVSAGPHTNFPVLISITDADLQANALSTGYDILFTSDDGSTKLAHEIETYTSGTGTLVAWVQAPSVSSSANTFIYMYYGNAAASNQQNVTGTWDANYKGVWHMNTVFTDATSNANNGTNTGTSATTGKISGGRGYNTADGADYITISGLMGSPANVTLSGWGSLTSRDFTGAHLINIGDYVSINVDDVTDGYLGAYYNGGWGLTKSSPKLNPAGTGWHYFVYTFDDVLNTQVLYMDGVQVGSGTYANSIQYTTQGSNTFIGKHGNGSTNFDFNGTIDEVRVSNSVRSAGWILTEYNNQSDPSTFYSIGAPTKMFTGTGNFSTTARWSGSSLPVAGDNLIIDGACTVDNNVGTDNVAYGTLTIATATGRTLNWPSSGTNKLNVSDVSAGPGAGTLDMTNGGTLIIRGTWTSTNLSFTSGAGTIEIQSAITLPAAYATYNNLTVNSSATVTAGVNTTINGNLSVSAGTMDLDGYTAYRASTGGTLTVSNGATLKIGSTNTLPANYSTHSIGATSTIEYSGTNQSVGILNSSQNYGNLIISGSGTKTLAETEAVDNDLTIASGCILSVSPIGNLTVSGAFSNNAGTAGFILESSASGTGSLINNTAGVSATMQRYMTSNRWHIISTPVSGQSAPGFLTDAANTIPTSGSNYGMMYYNETTGGWVYYTNPAAGTFSVGSGYLTRHTNDDAVSFQGTLNADDIVIPVTKNRNGWNCIGNPFPCSVGVREDASTSENFLDYNAAALDPSYAVLYLWDEPAVRVAGVSYYGIISNAGYSGGRPVIDQAYLQPGQGFLLKANTAGNVTFTRTMRLHENTGSYFKSARAPWPGLEIVVSSTTKTASTSLTFENRMTPGLDVTYDAGLLGGDPSFRIYSRLAVDNGINFMLQCLPVTNFEYLRIPLGFDCTAGGTVTFSNEIVSLPAGLNIVLEDSVMRMYTSFDMANATYSATINPKSSGIGRFFLNVYNNVVTSASKKIDFSDLNIYAYQKQIIVKGPVSRSTRLHLYDLAGRIVKTYNLQPGNLNVLPANDLKTGIYVVKLFGNNNNENRKVFLE